MTLKTSCILFILLLGCTFIGHSQTTVTTDSLSSTLAVAKALRFTNPEAALAKAKLASKQAKVLKEDETFALAEQLLSRLYAEKADYLAAVESGLAALEVFQRLGLEREVCITYLYLGVIYRYQRQHDRSISYYKEAESIAITNNFDTLTAGIWGNMGNVYYDIGELDKALAHHEKSLAADQKLANERGIGNSLHNIGMIYREQKRFEKAIDYYQRSLDLDIAQGNKRNIGISKAEFSSLYLEMKEYQKALQSANEALEVAKETNSNRLKYSTLRLLPIIHAALGNMESALAYNEEFQVLNDSIQATTLAEKIAEMQTKYETQEKDDQLSSQTIKIDQQQTSITHQRQWLLGLSLLFILSLFSANLLFTRYRLKQKNRRLQLENEQFQLKQEAEQIRQMDQMKSQFFANISHEFRTPLNLILAPLEQQKPIAPPEVNMMRRNARRLLRLVNQLLDLAKIEVGLLKLENRKLEVARFLSNIAQSFLPLAKTKNINYQIDIPERDYVIMIDPDKLEKIVYNLLSNAFKFTPTGGKVSISMAVEKLGQLRLTVSDTGIGIAESLKDKIFDRFYQVDNSETRPYEGTGIGLALTKELVDLFGGELSIDSQVGSGSIFTILIPMAIVSRNNDPIEIEWWSDGVVGEMDYSELMPLAVPAPNEAFSGNHLPQLLIVEDNAELRQYLRRQLGASFQLLDAPDGEDGLRMAQQYIPDLIVTDIMMPKMDGVSMTKALRADNRTSHIPIVLLTARDDEAMKVKGFETGAEQYLVKPFKIEELVARLNSLINQRDLLQRKFSQEVVLQPKAITMNHRDADLLTDLIKVIEDNMENEAFSVDHLQKQIGMSRMQLHRKLKALTNQSASEFIRSIKLKRAAQILQQGGVQVTEVAYLSGFNHLSYFAKCFKEQFGQSPSEYLKSHAQ